jgi:hypothetical protein
MQGSLQIQLAMEQGENTHDHQAPKEQGEVNEKGLPLGLWLPIE